MTTERASPKYDGTTSLYFPEPSRRLIRPFNYLAPLQRAVSGLSALGNLRIGQGSIAFEGITGENGWETHKAPGLESYQFIEGEGDVPPVYIFDQHNLAIFAVAEAIYTGAIAPGATLINIDTHPDSKYMSRSLGHFLDGYDRGKTLSDTNTLYELGYDVSVRTEIDEWIATTRFLGFINDQERSYYLPPNIGEDVDRNYGGPIVSGIARLFHSAPTQTIGWNADMMQKVRGGEIPQERLVLSVDIDYFATMTDEQAEAEMPRIREAIKNAGVVIVATSPGYIDQERAIDLTRRLLGPLYQKA